MNKELNISNLITYINLIHALIKKAKYDIANATIEVSDINVALTFAFGFFGIKKNIKDELVDLNAGEIELLCNKLISLGYEVGNAEKAILYLVEKQRPRPLGFALTLLGLPIGKIFKK